MITLPSSFIYVPWLIVIRIGPKVSYESSYTPFEVSDSTNSNVNKGRKTFGGFVADIDVLDIITETLI
jgi:hypothetical protein